MNGKLIKTIWKRAKMVVLALALAVSSLLTACGGNKENNTVSDKQVKLYIRGRDVGNDAFVIEMQDCRWAKVGTLEEMQERDTLRQYQNNPIVREVNKALEESGQWRGRMTELIKFAERNSKSILLCIYPLSIDFVDNR